VNDFKEIKQDAIDSMTACKEEAKKWYSVVVPQGVHLSATFRGQTLVDASHLRICERQYPFNSIKLHDLEVEPVRYLIDHVINLYANEYGKAAIRFSLWSGFDGAHSLEDLRDGQHDVSFADWYGTVAFDYELKIWED